MAWMQKGRKKCAFLCHVGCSYSENCSQPGKKIKDNYKYSCLHDQPNLREHFREETEKSLVIVMLFCLFWGWSKISCNWVWGPETARSHDVWATICHYTICQCCFNKQEVPKNRWRTWQRRISSDILSEEDWWDWTDSRWCGYISWRGLFPPTFFWGRSQYTWTAFQPV